MIEIPGRNKRRWRSPKREAPDESKVLRDKFFYFRILVLFLFGILTLQLMRMQVFHGEAYEQRAESNRLRIAPLMPSRGLVFDRNGMPLVVNAPHFVAGIVAADFPEEKEAAMLPILERLLNVPAAEIAAKVDEKRDSNDPFTPVIIKSGLDTETAFTLRQMQSELPGVKVIVQEARQYTVGPLMAHILGSVGMVTKEEYEDGGLKNEGYAMNDRVGKTGVELQYESQLRGEPGRSEVEVDATGREIQTMRSEAATPGSGLVLSLDLDLQSKTAEFLQAGMGASSLAVAIVMKVDTGELLSMVSLPFYDNNALADITNEQLQALLDSPGKPLVNHAISDTYAPGSIFKQITGTGALQEGVANAGTTITSYGYISVKNEYDPSISYIFRDWAAHGTMDFYAGVALSSDVYFYYLAGGYYENGREVFHGMGEQKLAEFCRQYGLGARTGIDLPGEAEGIVPDPAWKEAQVGEPWTIGDTYNFAIGQGYVNVTPLQMAVVTSAVANGGYVMAPRVVRDIVDPSGKVVTPFQPVVTRRLPISDDNLEVMRQGMQQAVSWSRGTATQAAVDGVAVAGKTGTAEFGPDLGGGHYAEHGWFAGFAPADNPEVAIIVFVERGNGAKDAAPIAGKILDYYFHRQ
jgi:penicillin-binding protein 2